MLILETANAISILTTWTESGVLQHDLLCAVSFFGQSRKMPLLVMPSISARLFTALKFSQLFIQSLLAQIESGENWTRAQN